MAGWQACWFPARGGWWLWAGQWAPHSPPRCSQRPARTGPCPGRCGPWCRQAGDIRPCGCWCRCLGRVGFEGGHTLDHPRLLPSSRNLPSKCSAIKQGFPPGQVRGPGVCVGAPQEQAVHPQRWCQPLATPAGILQFPLTALALGVVIEAAVREPGLEDPPVEGDADTDGGNINTHSGGPGQGHGHTVLAEALPHPRLVQQDLGA